MTPKSISYHKLTSIVLLLLSLIISITLGTGNLSYFVNSIPVNNSAIVK